MNALNRGFAAPVEEKEAEEFVALRSRSMLPVAPAAAAAAATATFHGFDVDDQPLLVGVPGLEQEVVRARASVGLRQSDIGSTVVLLFDGGEARRPIVVGVLQRQPRADQSAPVPPPVTVHSENERLVISAEREITLRCGEASLTLTRAGKVIIKGAYIVSRATGYNKIKGAIVDIN